MHGRHYSPKNDLNGIKCPLFSLEGLIMIGSFDLDWLAPSQLFIWPEPGHTNWAASTCWSDLFWDFWHGIQIPKALFMSPLHEIDCMLVGELMTLAYVPFNETEWWSMVPFVTFLHPYFHISALLC